MSLDKAIKYKKEKRKQYRNEKKVSTQCRNHGSCDWCKGNRTYNTNKKLRTEKKSRKANCLECVCFIPYGEDGIHICDAEEPKIVMEEYIPTDDYFWCNGTLFESWDEYD